jgi:hypothetical protein
MSPENELKQLKDVRLRLLRLHKMLLDQERAEFEKVYGSVTSGQLLQLVINHEQFAWLHSISELVVRIDEMFDAENPMTSEEAKAFLAEAGNLLSPAGYQDSFKRKYYDALQSNPDVVLAHSELTSLLARATSE